MQNFIDPTLCTELMEILIAEQGEMEKNLKVVRLGAFFFLTKYFLKKII